MNKLVSDEQWSGWFSSLGQTGVVVQNIINVLMGLILAGLAILFVFLIIRAAGALAAADGAEQRREAKVRIAWMVFGLVLALVGPTLIILLMNTMGNTVKTSDAGGTTKALASVSLSQYHNELLNKL